VQGIAAAFLVPGSLSIISAAFDEKSRGQAIGTWSGFTAITTALGPVLGGWLIEHASWHWIFFINVPLAVAVIGISLRHIPESRSENPQALDWMGAFTATLGLAGLVYGFLESSTLGWKNPRVPGSLAAGFAFLVWFALTEKRVAAPMVPLQLFKSRSFTGANLLTLFLYAALGIFFFVVPLNLIQVQEYSATRTGLALLPMILLLFLLSRWSGGLVARYGPKKPLIIGPLTAAVGFLLFAVPSAGSNYWTSFFPAFIVLGFGMAISVAPLTTVVMSSVEQNRVGAASGINNAVARVAGVLAIAVFGIVMVMAFSHALQKSLAGVGLPANVIQDVQSNAARLGGINAPSSLDPQTKTAIQHAVGASFIFGFRIIVAICGALAAASAAIAWRMIPSRRTDTAQAAGNLMVSSEA
jgi:EmrB/QacA subfamily drug resistance transporter